MGAVVMVVFVVVVVVVAKGVCTYDTACAL